jgi:hypothetical protein
MTSLNTIGIWSILLFPIAGATDVKVGQEVSYQIHSMNDLNEWNQLLLKGNLYLKQS